MKKFVTSLVLAVFIAGQPAIARAPVHLPQPVAPVLPIEVRLVQQEIRVQVQNNGGMAALAIGGVLGALAGAAINNAAANKAEGRVVDLRNALVDYDFNARFEQALRGVDLSPLSADPQLRFLATGYAADYEAGLVRPEERVLVVTPDYYVTNDFETMAVALNVMLVSRKANSRGKVKERIEKYWRTYSWTFRLPAVRGSNAEEDAGRLAALGEERLVAMLDRGLAEVVGMFAYDLTAEARAEIDGVPKGRAPTHELAGIKLFGRKLRGVDGQELVVRLHRVNAIQGVQLIDPDAPLPAADVAAGSTGAVAPQAPVAAEAAVTAEAPVAAEAAIAADAPVAAEAAIAADATAPAPVTADADAPAEAPAAGSAGGGE